MILLTAYLMGLFFTAVYVFTQKRDFPFLFSVVVCLTWPIFLAVWFRNWDEEKSQIQVKPPVFWLSPMSDEDAEKIIDECLNEFTSDASLSVGVLCIRKVEKFHGIRNDEF